MGVAQTFAVVATRPREEQLAFAEAALREPYLELQAAAFDLLADPARLSRPDLVFQRFPELLPAVRPRVAAWRTVFLAVAREQIREGRDRERRTGYEIVFEISGLDALPTLVQGVRDPTPLVRERAAELLEQIALRYYHHLTAARATGDAESRRFIDENRAIMLRSLEEILRLYPSHLKRVFLDVALESGAEAYSLFTDVVLVRPASQVYRACIHTLSVALTPAAVELLFRLQGEKDPLLREAAAEAMKLRRDPGFAGLLASWLAQLPPERFASLAARTQDAPWWGTVESAPDLDPAAAAVILDFVSKSSMEDDLRETLVLSLLQHPSREVRLKVLDSLHAARHPRVVEAAVRALDDPDDAVRVRAVRLILEINPPNKARILAPLLNSPVEAVRTLAGEELGRLSFARYLGSFDRLDPATRELAAKALAKIDPHMVERLAVEVSSLDPDRRLKALRAAAYAGVQTDLREVLAELLADPDRRVRATTVKLLHHSRNEEGMRVVVAALQDADPRVRANAIEALEDAGDPSYAVKIEPFLADADNRIRANAAKALLALGRPEARGVLEAMLMDAEEDMRLSAAWAIGEARYGGSEQALRARLQEETSPKVRERILEALEGRGVRV